MLIFISYNVFNVVNIFEYMQITRHAFVMNKLIYTMLKAIKVCVNAYMQLECEGGLKIDENTLNYLSFLT